MGVLGFPRDAVVRQGNRSTSAAQQGTLALTGATMVFTAQEGDTATQNTTALVTNAGGGSLAGPKVGTITYGAGSGWASASIGVGGVITVTVNPTGLAVGQFTATVPITDTNATNSPQNISVTFDIVVAQRPAVIVASSRRLTAVVTEGQNAATQTIQVTNGGDVPFVNLRITNINESWISPTIDTDTGLITVVFSTSALAAGTQSDARFDIAADNATNTPVRVGMIVSVVAAPAQLNLSPNVLNFNGVAGGLVASQTVTYTNTGGGSLGALGFNTIQYQQGNGWLSGVFNPSNANELIVTVDTTGVAPGNYQAIWPLTAASAGNSPQNLTVNFTIVPAPPQQGTIVITPSPPVTFSATVGGASPAAQTFTISDSTQNGLGTLGVGSITYGSGSGWLARDLTGNTLTVSASTGALTAATYTASFTVTGTNASNSPVTVNVQFTVAAAAPVQMLLSSSALNFSAPVGGSNPASQDITITSSGGSLGTLGTSAITYISGAGWLAKSLVGSTVTVTCTTGALTPATYQATFQVTSTTAVNSPITVTVNFTVTSASNLTFVAPIYTLPSFTTYDATTDLVGITPASAMDRAYSPPGGGSVTTMVDNGSSAAQIAQNTTDLQNEIIARAGSNNGWTIKCPPGYTVTGIELKARPSAAASDIYIVSTQDAAIATGGTYANNGYVSGGTNDRARPADSADMWQIRCPIGQWAISVEGVPNVCHYVISGFEAAPNHSNFHHTIVQIAPVNTGANPTIRNSLANYPTYITLDRFYIHNNGGWGPTGVRQAIWFEAGYGKIRNGWVAGITDRVGESKTIATVCNPGPWSVQNCFLQSSGENIMCGGADPEPPGHVPGDYFIDFVHLHKDIAWNSRSPSFNTLYTGVCVKNNLEFKHGDRICVQRFICEENWNAEDLGGQVGIAVVPKTTNQGPNNSGPNSPGNHVYLHNATFRHFAIYNANGGFGLTGLTQQGSYLDEQWSRPQRLDVHSGVITLGASSIYGHSNGARNYHAQIICQAANKDFRLKRLSGVSADVPYCAFQFTGIGTASENDNGLWEDCCFQYGNWGFGTKAYVGEQITGTNEGDVIINKHTNTSVWQRIGLWGNPTFTPSTLATLEPEHNVLQGLTHADVYEDFNSAAPWNSDFTIIHVHPTIPAKSLSTSGAGGTVCGADWARLSVLLTGVRN